MNEYELPPHSVAATLQMTGRQRTAVSVQHAGTPDAFLTVMIGHSVVYMHTTGTAERFASVWRAAATDALKLPAKRAVRSTSMLPVSGVAQPSVVVHATGAPATVFRMRPSPGPDQPGYMHVQVGDLSFLLHDQRAFVSCAEAFIQAAAVAARDLPAVDLRLTAVYRAAPSVAGAQSAGAVEDLLALHEIVSHAQQLREGVAGVSGPLADLVAALDAVALHPSLSPTSSPSTSRPDTPAHPAARAAAAVSSPVDGRAARAPAPGPRAVPAPRSDPSQQVRRPPGGQHR